jgi:hypothetical protein
MKTIDYTVNHIRITIKVDDADYDWVSRLFFCSKEPFKALADVGFVPLEQEEISINE